MRLLFMGTPDFAVPSLATLLANGMEVAAVYSQPPRRSGRGHRVQPSPVHGFAEAHGLPVHHPENFKSAEEKERFSAYEADVAIVVAYGLILPPSILSAPRMGCLNVHGSLLPRWRGAAPIQRAIMAGDKVTGVQVMQMEKGLDTGPVLLSETVPISPTDTAGVLAERLSHIGADLLPRALGALSRDALVPAAQSEQGVTYADKITSSEAEIDWTKPAEQLSCHIRGLNPAPGAWTQLAISDEKKERLKVHLCAPVSATDTPPSGAAPGTLLDLTDLGLGVACGDGSVLRVTEVQRAGKARQSATDFLNGAPSILGTQLG